MQTLDPRLLYASSSFFLDYISGHEPAGEFFEHTLDSLTALVDARASYEKTNAREELFDALQAYNLSLGCGEAATHALEQLRAPGTLCVLGGQQAGFLCGPAFTLYKAASVIRAANWFSEQLGRPVVPVFWLASEDHDLAEINHLRWLDDVGAVRTVTFDWDGRGRPIEQLPITERVRQAFEEVLEKIPFSHPSHSALFSPAESDDYSRWHARILSRLFADRGLILVEPRIVRPLAGQFFARAMREEAAIGQDLAESAARLRDAGYPVPLDPERTGQLFVIHSDAGRHRLDSTAASSNVGTDALSPDAALRPLLADSLFPSIANILGPSELGYHAMLRPLYRRWGIPQPLAVSRAAATVLAKPDHELLLRLLGDVSQAMRPDFDPSALMASSESCEVTDAFTEAGDRLVASLAPLQGTLTTLDPSLDARWHQTVSQALHQLDRLRERALRADLARQGVSVKRLQRLKPWLRPMENLQERILSSFSLVATFGVEWLQSMASGGDPTQFVHRLIVLEENHE